MKKRILLVMLFLVLSSIAITTQTDQNTSVIGYCNDSDNGQEFYSPGYVDLGQTAPTGTVSYAKDNCNGNTLIEYFCKYDDNGNARIGSTTVVCPNGCQNGACIKNSLTSTQEYVVIRHHITGGLKGTISGFTITNKGRAFVFSWVNGNQQKMEGKIPEEEVTRFAIQAKELGIFNTNIEDCGTKNYPCPTDLPLNTLIIQIGEENKRFQWHKPKQVPNSIQYTLNKIKEWRSIIEMQNKEKTISVMLGQEFNALKGYTYKIEGIGIELKVIEINPANVKLLLTSTKEIAFLSKPIKTGKSITFSNIKISVLRVNGETAVLKTEKTVKRPRIVKVNSTFTMKVNETIYFMDPNYEYPVQSEENETIENDLKEQAAINNRIVGKIFLESLFNPKIYCARIEKCSINPRAKGYIGLTNGDFFKFMLTTGKTKYFNNYSLHMLDSDGRTVKFILRKEKRPNNEVFTELYQDFWLKINQTAIIKGTNLQIKLIKATPKTAIIQYYFKGVPQTTGSRESTSGTDKRVTPKKTTRSKTITGNVTAINIYPVPGEKARVGNSVTIRMGEKARVGNYDIYFKEVERPDVKTQPTDIGLPVSALLRVEKHKEQNIVYVNLNEPFTISIGDTGFAQKAGFGVQLVSINDLYPMLEEDKTDLGYPKIYPSPTPPNIPRAGIIFVSKNDIKSQWVSSGQPEISDINNRAETNLKPELVINPPITTKEVVWLAPGQSKEYKDYIVSLQKISGRYATFIIKDKKRRITVNWRLSNGWNLFSLPGKISEGQSNCEKEKFRFFEYVAENKKYVKTYELIPGKAYWLYNGGKNCEASGELLSEVILEQLPGLVSGWNFVPIITQMHGTTFKELGKECGLKAAFIYNPFSKKWQNITNKKISWEHIGSGVAAYTTKECKLSLGLSPPPLPPLPLDKLKVGGFGEESE